MASNINRIMRMCIFILYMNMKLIAALPDPELYWKSMLPATPMPNSITDLLRPSGFDAIFHGVTELNTSLGTMFTYGADRNINHQVSRFTYGANSNIHDKSNIAPFFLEKDLKFGHKMKFLFTQSSNRISFLPRRVVKSMPFSSTKMAEILNKFGVKPGSVTAKVMKNTIEECEETAIKGENKYCATSLESMLDFTILKLGKDVEALSTEVMNNETKKQEYKITNGVKKVGETKVVVCHKLDYVYAVFYCHKIDNTVAYTVSLEGADGSRVKAVSVCHRDTSGWDPKHLAFQMLKVKRGKVPICHFLFQHSIAWVPKQN